VKIVAGVRAGDHHDEEAIAAVKIAVADRRLEEVSVFLDPVFEIDRRRYRHLLDSLREL
jgi:hypothetical protein